MDIIIFSDNSERDSYCRNISNSREYETHIFPTGDINKVLKQFNRCELIYLDVSSSTQKDSEKKINALLKKRHFSTGIIDPDGKIKRIAGLFHQGLVDYLGPEECKEGISVKRIREVLKYSSCILDDSYYDNLVVDKRLIPVKNGWSDIKAGSEYTFCIIYISLGNMAQLKKNYGHLFIDQLIEKFIGFLESDDGIENGRIWTWDDNEGIILVPLNSEKFNVIFSGYQLMRDRIFVSLDYCNSPVLLSYTVIMHLGNLKYQPRGKTGTTISESINFIFHASELVSRRGNLYITDTLFSYIPEPLGDLFAEGENHEGHNFKQLKKLKLIKKQGS